VEGKVQPVLLVKLKYMSGRMTEEIAALRTKNALRAQNRPAYELGYPWHRFAA